MFWVPGWGKGKDRQNSRHEMGRATLPPFPAEGQTESQGQGPWKAPTLIRKQQFGQHLGFQGSRPSPQQGAAARFKATPVTVGAKPGRGLVSHLLPAQGSRAGTHIPVATDSGSEERGTGPVSEAGASSVRRRRSCPAAPCPGRRPVLATPVG